MKRITVLLMSLVIAVTAHTQNDYYKTPFNTQNFDARKVRDIVVETSGGMIKVEGGNKEGLVEVYVQANEGGRRKSLSRSTIEELLNRYYDVVVKTEGAKLTATAKRKNFKWTSETALSVSFVIYSAENVNTKLTTSGGSIQLQNVKGNQDFRTSGGSLTVNRVAGQVKGITSGGSITGTELADAIDLRTSGGSITVADARGDLRLNTSGGSINLKNLSGKTDARTSGGSIKANNISGDFKTSTSGGSINLQAVDGNLTAHTSGGTITAAMSGTRDYVKLSTSSGGVRLELPDTKNITLDLKGNRVNAGALKNFSGSVEKDRVKGSIGTGTLSVALSASNGNVDLSM